ELAPEIVQLPTSSPCILPRIFSPIAEARAATDSAAVGFRSVLPHHTSFSHHAWAMAALCFHLLLVPSTCSCLAAGAVSGDPWRLFRIHIMQSAAHAPASRGSVTHLAVRRLYRTLVQIALASFRFSKIGSAFSGPGTVVLLKGVAGSKVGCGGVGRR